MNPARDQEAMTWLLQVREAPADAALQRAFDQWLAADDRNRLAYLDALLAMNAAGAVTAPAVAPVRVPLLRRHAPVLGFAFGCLALLAMMLGPRWTQHWRADETSAPGEFRAFELADGSRLQLAPDSAIAVALGDGERRIELLRGAVSVDVGEDPRPLRVHYRDFEIRDIGTRFDVRGADATLRVAVAHGEVEVRQPGAEPVQLRAGEQAQWQGAAVERWAYRETTSQPGMLVLDHASATLALAQWSAFSGQRVLMLGRSGARGDAALDAVLPMRTPQEQRAALDTLARRFGLQVAAEGMGVVMLRSAE